MIASSAPTKAEELSPTAPPASHMEIALVAFCAAWIGLLLLAMLDFGYGRDQATFAYVGQVILDGGMPYRDAWDVKPPGIYLAFAAAQALYGPAAWGIRIMEVGALLAFVLMTCVWTRSWWGSWRIGLLGAAMALTLHVQLDFWHTCQAETFGGILVFAAAFLARDRVRFLRMCAIGVLVGMAALFKPTLLLGGVVIWAWKSWDAQPSGARGSLTALARSGLRTALPLALGAAVPVVACLGWFAARAALDDVYEVFFLYNRNHLQSNWGQYNFIEGLYRSFTDWLNLFSSVTLFGFVLLLLLRPWQPRTRSLLVPIALVAALLLGVAMQAKFYWYHYDAAFYPTGMLLGAAFWRLWERARTRRPLQRAGFFAFLVLAVIAKGFTPSDVRGDFWERLFARVRSATLGIPEDQHDELDSLFLSSSRALMNKTHIRHVAQELAAAVPPGETIYVWGNEPLIYLMADRRAPTRYFFNSPMRYEATARDAKANLMVDLAQRPPAAIIVLSRDVVPLDFFNEKDSSAELEEFPELVRFIKEGYEPYGRASYMYVYLRKGLPQKRGGS